jgi:hypothetical protein
VLRLLMVVMVAFFLLLLTVMVAFRLLMMPMMLIRLRLT